MALDSNEHTKLKTAEVLSFTGLDSATSGHLGLISDPYEK